MLCMVSSFTGLSEWGQAVVALVVRVWYLVVSSIERQHCEQDEVRPPPFHDCRYFGNPSGLGEAERSCTPGVIRCEGLARVFYDEGASVQTPSSIASNLLTR